MADKARQWTDKHLAEMEEHICLTYLQAQAELTAKWNEYMDSGDERVQRLYQEYLKAEPDKKADALKRYQDALQAFTLRNQWFKNMVNETTYRIAHVNEIAVAYVNGEIPRVYAENFNQIDPEAQMLRKNWALRDEHMVRNMLMDTLPTADFDQAKDMLWNNRQINSSVLQGVLQGESIDKMSKRLLPILHNNEVSARRMARTTVTRAENRGRLDRYKEYEGEGIVMSKVWIATPDSRVRDWHLSMDGQEKDIDKPFIDGRGNELGYPGDTSYGAPGITIWNCRCSMRSHIIGFRLPNGKIDYMSNYSHSDSLHASQIESERERRDMDG